MVWVSRFFPRLADRIAARKIRSLFVEEMEARRQQRHAQPETHKPPQVPGSL
jgi:hypothetical protein